MARSPSEQPDTSNMKVLTGTVTPIVGAPALPAYPPSPNPYLRTPLPAGQQLQPDVLRQFYAKGSPQVRIVPLPTTAQANINASAKGVATTVAKQVVATSGGGITSVAFTAPIEAVITGSPSSGPNVAINWAWATEAAATVFSGPNAAVSGFDASFGAAGGQTPGPQFFSVVGGTPSVANEWALFIGESNSFPLTLPTGWTGIAGFGNTNAAMKQLSGSPVTVSQTLTGVGHWAGAIAYFNGTLPTLTQSTFTVLNNSAGTTNLSFSGNTTAGDTVIVLVETSVSNPNSSVGFAISDSQGNTINPVAFAGVGFDPTIGAGSQVNIWVIQSVRAAAETITLTYDSPVLGALTIMEIPPPPILAAVPRFRPLPVVRLNINGPGGVIGNLPVTNLNGGTSATNTHFWRGDGTWAAPAFSNLSGNIAVNQIAGGASASGITFLRGDNTWAPLGTLGVADRLAQGANIAATTLYPVGGLGSATGQYRVSGYIIVSRAATTSSTLPDSRITYTDQDSGATITVRVTPGDTGNTTSTFQQFSLIVNAKLSTLIQYDVGQVTPFASVGGTTMQFAYHARTEFLG